MRQKDIKLLWGRAASRCSKCKANLAYDEKARSGAMVVGEQAHIVAESEDGPRGKSSLTTDERDEYANLILLCPTCHTVVDNAELDFPVERLHQIKTRHELWVSESLAEPGVGEDAAALVYAHVIDQIVDGFDLRDWKRWASNASGPQHRWSAHAPRRVRAARETVVRANWPGVHAELELAIAALAGSVGLALDVFAEHAKPIDDEELELDRFYKVMPWDAETYHRLHAEFQDWSTVCDELLREATRAANWFADCVRRDINPTFFLLEGKFVLVEQVGLEYWTSVREYEASSRPSSESEIDARLNEIIRPYRAHHKPGDESE